MCSSEERKAKCTQKHKKGENCCLCPTIDEYINSRVQPSSCLVVRGNWSEHDNMDDTRNSRKRMRASRSKDIEDRPPGRSRSRALSSSHAELTRPAFAAEPNPRPPVRSRLSSQNISDTEGETGPSEIGPGKHKPTKTSELRGQWMRGGYSLPTSSKKHLKEFNRLPFISCGKENRCFELVSDRVQRLNTEKKEEMIIKYNKDPHFTAAKAPQTRTASDATSEAPLNADEGQRDSTEGGTAEAVPEGEATEVPSEEEPSADAASTVATPPAETTTAAAVQPT